MLFGKLGGLGSPLEGLRQIATKLIDIGRADFRASQAEQKVRMSGEFERKPHAVDRLIRVSQTPKREG
jgi:hypothetical protein